MPKLSELTDYQPEEQVTPSGRLYVSPNMPTTEDGDYFTKPVAPVPDLPADNIVERIIKKLAETEFSPGTDMGNKLAGTGGKERYQLWPEKIVRSALTAIPDAYSGKIPMHDVDPETGELVQSQDMIGRALDMASFAGVGGMGGTGQGGVALGAGPSLRPALKYKDRLYKGKEGQQHMDVIPPQLYPEFQKMAMSGEDISHYNFGFVNDKGHFLSREDALKYGIDSGLIDPQAGKFGALTSTLMADSSKPGTAIEAMAKTAQPFYSALEHNVSQINQSKMNGEAWLGTLANKPGVKPEELDWTGLRSFLEENKGKPVTKEQVQEHLTSNKVELKEVQKGTGDLKKAAEDLQAAAGGPTVIKGQKLYPDEIEQGLWDGSLTPKDLPTNLQPHAEKLMSLRYQQEQPTKYHSYQLPGGENYREMLMTLPEKQPKAFVQRDAYVQELKDKYGKDTWDLHMTKEESNKFKQLQDEYFKAKNAEDYSSEKPYKSSHWDEPNILAHVRMNDRTIDGKKSLHLEEIQSDWHQQGRTAGYDDPKFRKAAEEKLEKAGYPVSGEDARMAFREGKLTEEEAKAIGARSHIPDAPFKKTWHELALKRMLREAAEKGYDRLSWTPGEAQAARYDLSKSVDSIDVKSQYGNKLVEINPKGGKQIGVYVDEAGKVIPNAGYDVHAKPYEGKSLADIVGKETADKILKLDKGQLAGDNLKIGGEGMKGFYDQIIPKALEKIGKEHGVKVKYHQPLATEGQGYKLKSENGKEYLESGTGFKIHDPESISQFKQEYMKPVHYIDIPQSLKDRAMNKGFPLFSGKYMFTPVDHKPDFGDDK